ncbi:hypothetical protein ACRYI5_02935 [Furfurilactobacillus sp. WILCCON 0119]|uniref:hypothetical protein n=1 Tax=Furfurilactobacillus entadae TaxID=2922307 RepID=UPI0035E9A19E
MNTQANSFYKEPWFGIVLTVIFFPAGIYVMYKFGPWKNKTKLILAICLSLLSIGVWTIAGLAPSSGNPKVGETWLDTSHSTKTVAAKTTLHMTVDHNGHVRLTGTTNLPEKTKLHVVITAKNTVVGDDVTVTSEKTFKTSPLTVNGDPLTPGTLTVHLTSAKWSEQPASVTKTLGTHGQQLRGKETSKHQQTRTIDFKRQVTYEQ